MSEWQVLPLGEVCELKRGYDLPNASRRHGTVPVISSSGPTGYHSEVKVNGPGVVTGRFGTLGAVYYIAADFWPLNTSLYVRDFKGNHPRYVAELLRTMNLGQFDSAAAVPGVNRNQLHTVLVRVPDRSTQVTIGSVAAAIDDLIGNTRQTMAVLEEMAATIYREWFVHYRYPGHDSEPLISSNVGAIPTGWEVMPASKALTVNPRVTADKSSTHPFMSMGDLDTESMVCYPSENRSSISGAKYQNGDTLFARITPSLENGKTGYVQSLAGEEVGIGSTEFIVLRGNKVGSAFTYFLARTEEFRGHAIASMVGASGRQRVRNECFGTLLLAVPPVELGYAFEALAQPFFQAVDALHRKSASLAALRELLLPKLVTGQIDVSKLDLDAVLEDPAA